MTDRQQGKLARAASVVGLVGCSKRKLAHAAPAALLYASPLFRLAARHCAASCGQWFVLSARHGLLAPDEVVAPYDLSLGRLGREGRAAWAGRIVGQLRARGLLGVGHRFELHAGAAYATQLAGLIDADQPLRGLGIGQRLAWYRRRQPTDPRRT
jgi:hypothetical protein